MRGIINTIRYLSEPAEYEYVCVCVCIGGRKGAEIRMGTDEKKKKKKKRKKRKKRRGKEEGRKKEEKTELERGQG